MERIKAALPKRIEEVAARMSPHSLPPSRTCSTPQHSITHVVSPGEKAFQDLYLAKKELDQVFFCPSPPSCPPPPRRLKWEPETSHLTPEKVQQNTKQP